jgi:hypothetical protein
MSFTTIPPYQSTQTSVMCGGKGIPINYNDEGGDHTLVLSAKGICWSIFPNPTYGGTTSNNIQLSGTNKKDYTLQINGLLPNTKYYVRAYMNVASLTYMPEYVVGYNYGTEYSFFTLSTDLDSSYSHCVSKDIRITPGEIVILPDGYDLIGIDYGGNITSTLKGSTPDCLIMAK